MDDPHLEAHLRKIALNKALELYGRFSITVLPEPEQLLSDITHVANNFYTFLKGETE